MVETRNKKKAIPNAKYKEWKENYEKMLEKRIENLEKNLLFTVGYSHTLLQNRLDELKEMLTSLREGTIRVFIFDDDITLLPE